MERPYCSVDRVQLLSAGRGHSRLGCRATVVERRTCVFWKWSSYYIFESEKYVYSTRVESGKKKLISCWLGSCILSISHFVLSLMPAKNMLLLFMMIFVSSSFFFNSCDGELYQLSWTSSIGEWGGKMWSQASRIEWHHRQGFLYIYMIWLLIPIISFLIPQFYIESTLGGGLDEQLITL